MKKIVITASIILALCVVTPCAHATYFCVCIGSGNNIGSSCGGGAIVSGSMGDYKQVSSRITEAPLYLSTYYANLWAQGGTNKAYDASTGWLCGSY